MMIKPTCHSVAKKVNNETETETAEINLKKKKKAVPIINVKVKSVKKTNWLNNQN